jgi:hypothetical protein
MVHTASAFAKMSNRLHVLVCTTPIGPGDQVNDKKLRRRPDSLFSTIMHDIHFWIPLIVLLAGLLFLHELR